MPHPKSAILPNPLRLPRRQRHRRAELPSVALALVGVCSSSFDCATEMPNIATKSKGIGTRSMLASQSRHLHRVDPRRINLHEVDPLPIREHCRRRRSGSGAAVFGDSIVRELPHSSYAWSGGTAGLKIYATTRTATTAAMTIREIARRRRVGKVRSATAAADIVPEAMTDRGSRSRNTRRKSVAKSRACW